MKDLFHICSNCWSSRSWWENLCGIWTDEFKFINKSCVTFSWNQTQTPRRSLVSVCAETHVTEPGDVHPTGVSICSSLHMCTLSSVRRLWRPVCSTGSDADFCLFQTLEGRFLFGVLLLVQLLALLSVVLLSVVLFTLCKKRKLTQQYQLVQVSLIHV